MIERRTAFTPATRAEAIALLGWLFLAYKEAIGWRAVGPSWEERHEARWAEIDRLRAEGRHAEAERLINAECGR